MKTVVMSFSLLALAPPSPLVPRNSSTVQAKPRSAMSASRSPINKNEADACLAVQPHTSSTSARPRPPRSRSSLSTGLVVLPPRSSFAVRPNPSLERDLHRHGTWPARRSLSSSASRAKRHPGSGPSAQTLGRTGVRPIHRYSLEPHDGPYDSWPLTSRLLLDGKPTDARIPGHYIEAQYESPTGHLVVTSYECPFEESNSFVLLNGSLEVVARAELGVPYGSFLLHEHWPVDESTLTLHYHEDLFYRLSVVQPSGWLRASPRLKLRRERAWQQDAQMREAHARLQQRLAEIETSSQAAGNSSAA